MTHTGSNDDLPISNQRGANGSTQRDETEPAISGSMSTSEILCRLAQHGCRDITNQIDILNSGRTAVSTGGSGDIYLGALLNGSRVGIKCLRILIGVDEEGRQRTKRAARELYVWSKCKHPNILELLGVAQYEGRVAMVSPWMKNGNLSWYISQHPEADRHHLCWQVADTVAYLRKCGVVHGDIKGANFVVSDDHIPLLTDFGSSAMSQCSLQFTTTEDSSKITVRWTAPEILLGDTKHTFEGDVYALGMTVLEIITGSVPWVGMLDVTVVGNLTQKRHPMRPVTHLPVGDMVSDLLWKLMVDCWTIDPLQRPPATKVRDELGAIREQLVLPPPDRVNFSVPEASNISKYQTVIPPTAKGPHPLSHFPPLKDPIGRLKRLFRLRSSNMCNPLSTTRVNPCRLSPNPLTKMASLWRDFETLATGASSRQNNRPQQGASVNSLRYGSLDRGSVGPSHGSRKALLIGSSYKSRSNIHPRFSVVSLNGVPHDFEKLESVLTERGYLVQTLPEEEGFDRNRILTWIAHFVDHATSGDVRAIVFSGHGHFHDNGTVSLIPPECPNKHAAISCAEWTQNIRKHARPGVVIFSIMDHCYSGEVMKQEFDRRVWEVPALTKPSTKDEPIYLTFAAGDKAAYESQLTGGPQAQTGGHFTQALIGAIRSVDATTDTWVEFFEAFDRHFSRVRLRASWIKQESIDILNPNWSLDHAQAPRFSVSGLVELSTVF